MKKIKAFCLGAAAIFAAVCLLGCAQDSENNSTAGSTGSGTVEKPDAEETSIQSIKDECTINVEADENNNFKIDFTDGHWEVTKEQEVSTSNPSGKIYKVGKFIYSNGNIFPDEAKEYGTYTFLTESDALKALEDIPSIFAWKREKNIVTFSVSQNLSNIKQLYSDTDDYKDYTSVQLLKMYFEDNLIANLYNYSYDDSYRVCTLKRNEAGTKFYATKESFSSGSSTKSIFTYSKID